MRTRFDDNSDLPDGFAMTSIVSAGVRCGNGHLSIPFNLCFSVPLWSIGCAGTIVALPGLKYHEQAGSARAPKPARKECFMSGKRISRRRFLGTAGGAAAAGAAFTIVSPHVLGGPDKQAPSDKMNVAVIGVGRQGSYNAHTVRRTDNVVALCDVDEAWAGKHMGKLKDLPGVKLWPDYRVMLDKMGSGIDAVGIASP